MPIDPLPSISRSDANFRTQVDDYFLTRLPAFSTQAESARVQIVGAESAAASAASTATTAAATATSAASGASSSASSASTSASTAATAKNAAEAAAAQAVSGNVATPIHEAVSKTTPVDADEIGLSDSAATWGLKKLTFANLKAWLSGLYVGKTGAQAMAGDLTVPSLNGGQLAGLRNKIINGGFSVNQRAYVSGAATTAGQYLFDRWNVTGTGGVTFSTTANKVSVTIPSGQTLQQVIEGLNLQTGTYVLSWEGTAQGRIAGGSYGVSGAVTATITGGTNTTVEFNTGTVANVQLEIGSVATPFEHRPYGVELALCQRYYYRLSGATKPAGSGVFNTTTNLQCLFTFPVPMRATPSSLEQSGTPSHYDVGGTACSVVPTIGATVSESGALLNFGIGSATTIGYAGQARIVNAAGYLGFSAEL